MPIFSINLFNTNIKVASVWDFCRKRWRQTDLLLTQWPRSNFYRLRNGERALSPDAQQEVAKALRKVGITQEPVFDRYSEVTDWG